MSARERVAACRRYLARRGGVGLALLVGGTALLALPVAWVVAGPEGWRPGSAGPLLLLAVALGAALGAGLLARRRLHAVLADSTVVARMEGAAGLPEGRLQAQLELPDGPLVRVGESRLQEPLNRDPAELAGAGRGETGRLLRVGGAVAGAAALLALGAWGAGPERAGVAWAGLVHPLGVLNPPPLPALGVSPGDAVVPRGEAVEVVVVAPGRRAVRLEVSSPGVPDRTLPLEVVDGVARGRIPAISAPVRYRAVGDDGLPSPHYLLEPADPLVLGGFELEVVYPPWTGRPPEVRRTPPRSLAVPAGTRLVFSGTLGAPVEALELRRGEGPALGEAPEGGAATALAFELAEGGRSFEGRWTPRDDGLLHWWASPGAAAGHALPAPLALEVIPDTPPLVRLAAQGGGGEVRDDPEVRSFAETPWLPADLRLPLLLDAEDDWGLDWVALEVTVLTPGVPVETRVDRTRLDGERTVALRPVLDLRRWGLEPGTRLRVQARAGDQGAPPGEGASGVLEFRVPTPGQIRDEARAEIGRTSDRVRELTEEAAAAGARDAGRYRDQVAAGATDPSGGTGGGMPAAEALQGLREALAGETRLLQELEALREALSRSGEALGGQGEDRALQRELARLEDALDRAAGPEARAQAEARLEALEARMRGEAEAAPGSDETARELGASVERQEALLQQLEELRERLEAAQLQAEVTGAREEAARLAEDQEARARALRDPAADPGAEEPGAAEALAERARALEARVQALEARLQEGAPEPGSDPGGDPGSDPGGDPGGDPAAATPPGDPSTNPAGDAVSRASAAASEARVASEAMEAAQAAAAARRAEEALAEVEGADAAAREAALRLLLASAAHQALALEEALMAPASPAGHGGSGAGATADVTALMQGARILAGDLSAALVDAGEGARELAARMGAALAALEAVMQRDRALQAGLPGSRESVLAGARGALQQLALAALDALDRVGESGEAGEGGDGGSGSPSTAEALESLAGEQDALNQQAAGLDGQPGDPSSSGEARGRMEALAREQEGIASALGRMGEELRREGQGGELRADDLEALAREAEALAEALAASASEGRPTAETLDRQDRLLERLLDAGRSMERDEPSGERQGTPAGPVVRPPVPPLPAGLLDAARIPVPSEAALSRLTPAERRLVLEYLERLARSGGEP